MPMQREEKIQNPPAKRATLVFVRFDPSMHRLHSIPRIDNRIAMIMHTIDVIAKPRAIYKRVLGSVVQMYKVF